MPSSISDRRGPVCERPVEHSSRSPRACASNAARAAARDAAAAACPRVRSQDHGAHHRRRRERDDEGDQHGRGQRDRELAEQPPHDAAHEQQRDEHRDERHADREHGEADLACAEQRRLNSAHALVEVPRDVLEHDDRVVDDEARRDRERHQRQIVQAIAREIHDAERAEQRRDDRDGRHERRAQVREEQLDHDDHEQPSAINSVISTSCSDARIVTVRSMATSSLMSPGRSASSCGSSAFTRRRSR